LVKKALDFCRVARLDDYLSHRGNHIDDQELAEGTYKTPWRWPLAELHPRRLSNLIDHPAGSKTRHGGKAVGPASTSETLPATYHIFI
jgi:hypothetical protein